MAAGIYLPRLQSDWRAPCRLRGFSARTLTGAVLLLCMGPLQASPCTSIALVLSVDSSSSVDDWEFELEKRGLAQPCRHLIILTPGGFEGFFAEMAQGRFRIPEDMEQIGASAARHSLRYTGPPLGAG